MSENSNISEPKKVKDISPINVLSPRGLKFGNPLKDMYTATIPIAGCAWVETDDGVVLINTLITIGAGKKVFKRIRGKIKYIIYTHGYRDHIFGTEVFMANKPEIIASKYLPDRFDKYRMLAPHRAQIALLKCHNQFLGKQSISS